MEENGMEVFNLSTYNFRLERLEDKLYKTDDVETNNNIIKEIIRVIGLIIQSKNILGKSTENEVDDIEYYNALLINNRKDFKAFIVLDNGKKIAIDENTSLSNLNLEELEDANKKLSSLINLISKILKQ
jgi:hypothetical protein